MLAIIDISSKIFQGIDQSSSMYDTIGHAPFRAIVPFGAIMMRVKSSIQETKQTVKCSYAVG
jgi:hypothetical protein